VVVGAVGGGGGGWGGGGGGGGGGGVGEVGEKMKIGCRRVLGSRRRAGGEAVGIVVLCKLGCNERRSAKTPDVYIYMYVYIYIYIYIYIY